MSDEHQSKLELSFQPNPRLDWATLALERSAHGVAILDASSTLHFANRAALIAIGRAGWELQDNRLSCALAADRHAWSQALLASCLHQRHKLLELHALGGASSVFVSLAPLRWGDLDLSLASFEREELCGSLVLEQFAARHGLTLTEGQVLQRLCHGLRPADIAREHGVSRTTVLSQVAAIRVKTRRDSVQSLLNKLSRMPAMRSCAEIA
jgi:DNA-binding CsgD family transcriptional regulator